jgi:hypothetical protein
LLRLEKTRNTNVVCNKSETDDWVLMRQCNVNPNKTNGKQ